MFLASAENVERVAVECNFEVEGDPLSDEGVLALEPGAENFNYPGGRSGVKKLTWEDKRSAKSH